MKKFRGEVQWDMLEAKDFVSSMNLKLKNEDGTLVSVNGHSIILDCQLKKLLLFEVFNLLNSFLFNKRHRR